MTWNTRARLQDSRVLDVHNGGAARQQLAQPVRVAKPRHRQQYLEAARIVGRQLGAEVAPADAEPRVAPLGALHVMRVDKAAPAEADVEDVQQLSVRAVEGQQRLAADARRAGAAKVRPRVPLLPPPCGGGALEARLHLAPRRRVVRPHPRVLGQRQRRRAEGARPSVHKDWQPRAVGRRAGAPSAMQRGARVGRVAAAARVQDGRVRVGRRKDELGVWERLAEGARLLGREEEDAQHARSLLPVLVKVDRPHPQAAVDDPRTPRARRRELRRVGRPRLRVVDVATRDAARIARQVAVDERLPVGRRRLRWPSVATHVSAAVLAARAAAHTGAALALRVWLPRGHGCS